MSEVSVFTHGRLIRCDEPDDELWAADSWLVDDGAVAFLADHRDRFRSACAPLVDDDDLTRFWAAAVDALPRSGRWFPRVESSTAGQLRLRIRPAPPPGRSVTVECGPPGDPRSHPRVKGPDLALLARLRATAVARGADEHLLRAPDGVLVEGVTTSLMWWAGNELCVPADDLPCLPGVTAARLRRRAADLGVRVRGWRAVPDHLAGLEVWLVNSLHGIRPVRGWAGTDVRPGPAVRAPYWQAWLVEQARALPPVPAPAA